MGFFMSVCRRLTSWVVSSKSPSTSLSPSPSPSPSRRHGRRRHFDDYSSNGDMERSPSEWSGKDEEEQASPSATQPAQLGCVNGQQMTKQVGPPVWAKMAKIDTGLQDATEILKPGGSSSGTIRKGMWLSDEGLETPVAIKIFHRKFDTDMIKQVSKELIKGQVLRHRNLLCPIGYCFKKRQLHLFYHYMVNGSLDQHLFTKESSPDKVLSWPCRCSVINGLATGLNYLHSNGAVHGSIKCSNILLDQDMTARLGDFGYSTGQSMLKLSDITYLPPECNPETVVPIDNSGPTLEKDVFFFGSVILEVVCGRKTSSRLVDWVWELYKGGNTVGAVDQTVSAAADFAQAEAHKLLVLGLSCSHPDPKQRPQMQDVVDILGGNNVPLPVVPLRNLEYTAAPIDSGDEIDPDQVRHDESDRVSEWLRDLPPKPQGKRRRRRRR